MNYITHRHFFFYLYQLILWYLTRILTFLSEQWAPFSSMFASRAFHNVIWSQHSAVQVSIFITWLNFAGTGSRLWQLYVAFVMTWYLAFKTSGRTAKYRATVMARWPVIACWNMESLEKILIFKSSHSSSRLDQLPTWLASTVPIQRFFFFPLIRCIAILCVQIVKNSSPSKVNVAVTDFLTALLGSN